ncbi:MAG: hypothetical protein P8144_13615, partial [Gammaproteobacteria bacterium]
VNQKFVSAPVANHTIPPQASRPVEFPPDSWREIAAVASAHSVLTLRQVSRDMRSDENISPALQEFFAHSNDANVRRALAGKHSLSSEAAQERLTRDPNRRVRMRMFLR